jgi:hypothetical protein
MIFALLAASLVAQHRPLPATIDGRIALLEARQMLESQQVWTLRSELPPEALRTINDVQLHVQHDQEQEDKVRDLTSAVSMLEQRLATLELALQEKAAVEGRIPVAPMQVAPIEMAARPRQGQRKKTAAKKPPSRKAARVAEVP